MADKQPLFFVAYRVGEGLGADVPLTYVKGDDVTTCAQQVAEHFNLSLDSILLVPVGLAAEKDIARLTNLMAAEFYLAQFALLAQATGRIQPAGSVRLVT